MPAYFTRTFCFSELNDTEVDAEFEADHESGVCKFIGCTFGTLRIDGVQAERIEGNEFRVQMKSIEAWWSEQNQGEYQPGYGE